MATDWQAVASEQAELISSRLRELLSSGQGYIRSQFGIELGLQPELYPSWAVISAALLGLLLLSWAVVSSGWKKRSPSGTQGGEPQTTAPVTKSFKSEEQKKRNKKKPITKKAQSNGHADNVSAPAEEVRAPDEISKPSPPLAPEIAHEKVKKNKKKPKAEVKSSQSVADGKEPDDGAWETKVSNREKKQQRRKDKVPDASASPDGATPSNQGNQPVVSAPTPPRKNREALSSHNNGKGEPVLAPGSSGWRQEPSVNGGGWANVSMNLPAQMSALEGEKWPAMPTVPRHRTPDPPSWGQDTEGTLSGMYGGIKTDINSVTFSVLGMNNTTVAESPPADLAWEGHPAVAVDDEWSGFNGLSEDPSSDWSAPTELWGNYEAPPPIEDLPPETPALNTAKVSDEERQDAGGVAKSKRKKKKKKAEEESTAGQVSTANTELEPTILPEKCEQTAEAPKPGQKKKVRRET